MTETQKRYYCFKEESCGGFLVTTTVSERERPHTTVIAPLERTSSEIDSSRYQNFPVELESYLRRKMLARLSRRSGVSGSELQHEAAQAVEIYTARYPRWWAPKAESCSIMASRPSATAKATGVLVDSERVLQLDAFAALSSGSILSLIAARARPADIGATGLADRAARALVGAEALGSSAFLIGPGGHAAQLAAAELGRPPSSSPAPARRMEPEPPAAGDEDAALHPSVAAWRRRRQGPGTGSPTSASAASAGGATASPAAAAGLAYARHLGAFGTEAPDGGVRAASAAAELRPAMALEAASPTRGAVGIASASISDGAAEASPPPTPSSVRHAARKAGGAVTRELLAGRLVRQGYREYIACAGSPEQRRLRVALVAAAMEHPQWHSPATLASNAWFQGPFYSGSPPAVMPADDSGVAPA